MSIDSSAISSGFQDGWPRLSVTECCGRTIIVSSFLVAIYKAYYEQGRSCRFSGFGENSLLNYHVLGRGRRDDRNDKS